jgi:hypothetical protein
MTLAGFEQPPIGKCCGDLFKIRDRCGYALSPHAFYTGSNGGKF